MRLLIRAAAVAALILPAVPASAQSLTDTLIFAYRNSGLLDQNRALLRAADEDVAQAVAALGPVLNYTASLDYRSPSQTEVTATFGLAAQITLWDGGQSELAIDAAKEAVLVLREQLVGAEQEVLLAAVDAHMNVLSAREFVALREANVRVVTRELRAAEDRFEVGEITRTDVSVAEARLALTRSQITAAQGTLAAAREGYRAVTGQYPTNLTQPPAPPVPSTTLDGARGVAVISHPAIREAQRNVTLAELNVERARATRRPTLSASGVVSYTESPDIPGPFGQSIGTGGTSRSLGVELSGPLYSSGRIDSRERQSVARSEAARAGLLTTVRQIEQQVGIAFANLATTRAIVESGQRQVRAQEQAFEGIREEATLGARTTLDVLNAEQELLNARVDVVDALAQQYIAAYQLLSAQGLLTVDYLNLGIVTYDPSAYYRSVSDAPVTSSEQGAALDRVLEALGR
ncbi:outer membrane protein [Hasllibacter halocynthiae]|uniref:Outer membrane protein n=1 Tax=Hasllibacter halocynthiae TaxID=595589 RepID=A0A2T0X6E4_9RHOB|nr:TolC family outer membrane protein [Hasllibacter halocynthiae]PRY94444.1 outer membrane protein [Hasllibacter halocynthiae]